MDLHNLPTGKSDLTSMMALRVKKAFGVDPDALCKTRVFSVLPLCCISILFGCYRFAA
jgi:hypothetical protein